MTTPSGRAGAEDGTVGADTAGGRGFPAAWGVGAGLGGRGAAGSSAHTTLRGSVLVVLRIWGEKTASDRSPSALLKKMQLPNPRREATAYPGPGALHPRTRRPPTGDLAAPSPRDQAAPLPGPGAPPQPQALPRDLRAPRARSGDEGGDAEGAEVRGRAARGGWRPYPGAPPPRTEDSVGLLPSFISVRHAQGLGTPRRVVRHVGSMRPGPPSIA